MKKTMMVFALSTFALAACSSEATSGSAGGGEPAAMGEQDQADVLYSQIVATGKPVMPANFVTMPKKVKSIDEAANDYAVDIIHEEAASEGNGSSGGGEPSNLLPDRCTGVGDWAEVCCYHTGSGSRFCCTIFGGNDGNASGCGANF